jgi:hypothetical protein
LASSKGESKDQEAAASKSEATQSSDGSNKDGKPSEQESSSLLAKASDQNQDQKPNEGSQPPPNEMSKRMLDAGQCSACKPLRVTVDEWAGTFEGEKRQKLEIAIAPVLEKLATLLKMADAKTDSLKAAVASPDGLQEKDAEPLNGAKAHVADSESEIAD